MADGPLDFKDIERRMDGAIASLKNDLGGLRTGRGKQRKQRAGRGGFDKCPA